MSKLVEVKGLVTMGARRVKDGIPIGAWIRIPTMTTLWMDFVQKSILWGNPQEEAKSSTVLFSIAGSFDHASKSTFMWQRKADGSRYLELPERLVPPALFNLIADKPKGFSLEREAWLYKTGVLQIRS